LWPQSFLFTWHRRNCESKLLSSVTLINAVEQNQNQPRRFKRGGGGNGIDLKWLLRKIRWTSFGALRFAFKIKKVPEKY
jgi:hypothetical protein